MAEHTRLLPHVEAESHPTVRPSVIRRPWVWASVAMSLAVVGVGRMQWAPSSGATSSLNAADYLSAEGSTSQLGTTTGSSHHSGAHDGGNRVDKETIDGPPHIIFVLLDDVGYNDMLSQSTDLKAATPKMNALAEDGVTLSRYYQEHSCTPGRAVVLTGRYLWSTGMQFSMVFEDSPWALRSEYVTIAESLRELGYSTHMAGKWDVGHYAPEVWPTNQGFDTFIGLVQQQVNYNTYACCDVEVNGTYQGNGYDLQIGLERADDESYQNYYATYLFGNAIINSIQDHSDRGDTSSMFLYVPFNGIHAPVYLPVGYDQTVQYQNLMNELDIPYAPRAEFAAALNLVDEAVANIMEAMKTYGYYNNSILVVTSDNGAPTKDYGGENGGSSYPLRGGKTTLFEGGLRVPAFVHSPLIPTARHGVVIDTLFHGTDWLPTLVQGAAGGSASFADGIDQWDYLTGVTTEVPRTEIPLQMDYVSFYQAGLILSMDGTYYKLMKENCALWYSPLDGNVTSPDSLDDDKLKQAIVDGQGKDCDDYEDSKLRLYDLLEDPSETVNLYDNADYADVLKAMNERFCQWYQSANENDSQYRDGDPIGMFTAMEANNGYITYWHDSELSDGLVESKNTSWTKADFKYAC